MPIDRLLRYHSEIETGNFTEWITTFAANYHFFSEITKRWYSVLRMLLKLSVNVTGTKSAQRHSLNQKRCRIFSAVLVARRILNLKIAILALNKKKNGLFLLIKLLYEILFSS